MLLAHPLVAAGDEEKPKGSPVVATASPDGFSIQTEDGSFKLQLKGLVQFDGRFYLDDKDNALTNNFLIRRARPILQGSVGKSFEFNFTPDFGGGTTVIQDAYAVAKKSPGLALRVGKFKPPIGVEHLQSDPDLFFIERALPSSLEPNRDVGAQLGGDLAKGVVTYAAGVFDGTPDGASVDLDTNDGKAVVGRFVLSPFKTGKSALKGLGLGIAASTEKQSGATATVAGYKTGGQNTFFSYSTGVGPAGTRTRWTPELSFFGGPVGILAEYVESSARLLKTTTTTATATTPAVTTTSGPFTFDNDAWQVAGSVFLTGDPASYKGPTIKKSFDPAKGQWGAVQLVARVNGFKADPDTFSHAFADIAKSASKASAWGVGITWFLNKNLKQAINFERTTFTGGAAKGADRPAENALLIRSEIKF
jgi:phosphate-selective porin OprO/OprP